MRVFLKLKKKFMKTITRLFHSPLFWVAAAILSTLFSCRDTRTLSSASTAEEPYGQAIRTIFDEDDRAATIRNHACEDTTLTETVRQYVAAIDAMDFSRCPADFTSAFKKHRDAWANTIPFFTAFDTLRGEMHELFAVIENEGPEQEAALEAISRPIGDSWEEVEKLARKYGARAEE